MAQVTVMEWQRVLLFVDGRLDRVLETGRHRYRARRSTLVTVETRPRQLLVGGQELLTRDGVSVRVSVVATWQVEDAAAFVTRAQNAEGVLYSAVQDAIRAAVGAVTAEELMTGRAALSEGLLEAITEQATNVGVAVTAAKVRDVMPPGELRRAAQEVLLARERGRAELERARGEAAALRSLANAARLIEAHPALLRLRTLQVADAPGTRIVLDSRPVPAED